MITLFLNEISAALRGVPGFRSLLRRIREDRYPIRLHGPQGSFLALILREMWRSWPGRPLLVVVPSDREAQDLVEDLRLFQVDARLFPWWDSVPYREAPVNSPVFGRRVRELGALLDSASPALVAPLRSFLTPVPDPDYLRGLVFTLRGGDRTDPVRLAGDLQRFGYFRAPRATVPGEFALRGEVLDLVPPGGGEAVRVVFDFDRIGEIRLFSPADQSSTGTLEELQLGPLKEVIWSDDRIEALEKRLLSYPEIRDQAPLIVEELIEKRTISGEELFFPHAFAGTHRLTDYLPGDTPVVFVEEERLDSACQGIRKEYQGLYRRAREEGRPVLEPERCLLDLPALRSASARGVHVSLLKDPTDDSVIDLSAEPPRSYFGNLVFFKEELAALTADGYRVYIFADSEAQARRIRHILQDFELEVLPEPLTGGFTFPGAKIAVIHEHEIFGRRSRMPRSVKTAQSRVIDTFVELSPEDPVVHVNYGIGRFKGIKRIKAGGYERDYIHLEYADQEYIYLPIEQVNLIQRYIGGQGVSPRLDKIGGKGWENRKSRVKKSVEDIASRLLVLYSRRKKARGFAFPPDGEWQIEFEAAFPFDETEDQLACIADVKADMEKPVPMDRMICGDVGYGKTEIALRAAFKAVLGGKQVALLAPTTILAEQHFETFSQRVRNFPLTIGMLSRFVPPRERRSVIRGLAEGKLDLVVGTHRLLQKDVAFRDLGLVIVDEEQRFGVKDKEKLKELKTSVDCLTLTATPIPRTLHMSLLKLRDMSVLKTPPSNRLPIETHILEFSEETVAQAVRRELARGGQVYYLHNRIETLDQVRLFLERLLPEAIVGTAHGRMSGEDLEDIMRRFILGGIQVLVSTTIVENGIDIPNVNTIIIDRADNYSISQLYQLRGRVGRSDRPAYAYLFYPEARALSEIAMKRLKIISDNTELGSGFRIALKDLEVRGAGNLLGREQSGDIMSVGFDMYLRLLDEAVRELENGSEDAPPEVYMELEYTGFIPEGYIQEAEEKMEVYKKIASIATDEELEGVSAELADRYGPLPGEVASLLHLAEIRVLCGKLHIVSLRERKGVLEVEFGKVARIQVNRVLALIRDGGGRIRLDSKRPQVLVMDTATVGLKEKSEFIRDRLSVLL